MDNRGAAWLAMPPQWLLCMVVTGVLAAVEGNEWLNCTRAPCLRQGQCLAENVLCLPGKVLQEGQTACGCCPGCVEPISMNEKCPDENETPCEDGSSCVNGICTQGPCWEAPGHAQWRPRCERDGSFSAVQCKGSEHNGRCFCWSPSGERLFGEMPWADAENMTCACSLRAWALAQEGRAVDAPHCSADGSFEELQCAQDVCWCADPRTGAFTGRAVPLGSESMLFCYNEAEVGSSYRRQCDSHLEAREKMSAFMAAHGTTAYGLPGAACELDGSYAPVQTAANGARFCANKDKSKILLFTEGATENTGMNCNCARDIIYRGVEEVMCQTNGNYRPYAKDGDKTYCLDQDGFSTKFVTISDECY